MPEHLQGGEEGARELSLAPGLHSAWTGPPAWTAVPCPPDTKGSSRTCHPSAHHGFPRTSISDQIPSIGRPLKCKVGMEKAPGLEGPTGPMDPGAHLPGGLDVEVVKPLQHGNPGHHPDGHVTEVAVQDLHDPIEVEGDWGPFRAVGKTRS